MLSSCSMTFWRASSALIMRSSSLIPSPSPRTTPLHPLGCSYQPGPLIVPFRALAATTSGLARYAFACGLPILLLKLRFVALMPTSPGLSRPARGQCKDHNRQGEAVHQLQSSPANHLVPQQPSAREAKQLLYKTPLHWQSLEFGRCC